MGLGSEGAYVGFLGVVYGLLGVVSGLLDFAFAYGAWFLKPWAWTVGLATQGISILFAVVGLLNHGSFFNFLLSAALAGAIIYVLFTPEVKRLFGRV
jgi:hypothetical protein